MAKFVLQCPHCGTYTKAKTGFFSKKNIECSCGKIINVKAEKMKTRMCSHCGNYVVYDQTIGEQATCPVCNEKINTLESNFKLIDLICPSCSCTLVVEKNEKTHTCPLCNAVINVEACIKKEEIKKEGAASVIKYDGGNDVFVWKHPIEDFNLGSQLIVHESQEAIFFKDGKALDLFGAGRYTLATQNLPLLENLYKLPNDTDTVFHSEVYFVNLTTQMGIKWGTDSKVRLFDPASGLYIELGACGNFNIRVSNSRKLLLKVVGTANTLTQGEVAGVEIFGITFLTGKFKALIINKVKANLARVIKENNINILEIDAYIDILSEKMRVVLNEVLDDYGLYMPEFFITNIMTPDDDPNFRRMKEQFAAKTLRVREEEIKRAEAEAAQGRKILEAQTEAQLKIVDAQGEAEALKIKAQAEAEAYRMQAFAETDEMKAKGYTYQQESSRMVGMEAMKNGITGNGIGDGSILGDIAGIGITLGTMGSVIEMTKDALSPTMQSSVNTGETITSTDTWECTCGTKNITSKFCPECGAKKIENISTWDCICGTKNITSNFCPDCGKRKP